MKGNLPRHAYYWYWASVEMAFFFSGRCTRRWFQLRVQTKWSRHDKHLGHSLRNNFRKFLKSSEVVANLINSNALESTKLCNKLANKVWSNLPNSRGSPITWSWNSLSRVIIFLNHVNEPNGACNIGLKDSHFNRHLGSIAASFPDASLFLRGKWPRKGRSSKDRIFLAAIKLNPA